MKKSGLSEEKIVSILREARGEMKVRDEWARHNISEQTCYGWRRTHGGMQVDELRQAWAQAEEPSAASGNTGGSSASWRT
ncbi:MAG: transposase [Verrucomicrobiaceae bacterium]|nr:transposase [Verrucomicrobiaceae bacterium]